MDKQSKTYWGPRVWRLFHLLANISDRRDVISVWRQLLRVSAVTLPCDKCRAHFIAYVRDHPILTIRDPSRTTGPYVRETLKENLRTFHNDVNRRLGKPQISKEQYSELYPSHDRGSILFEAQSILDELLALWAPLVHRSIDLRNYTIWKNTCVLLLALLKGGPTS
jgi:hypothetical protein